MTSSSADRRLRDLGEHRLKDLIEAERLFQLGEGEFPPLRTLDATNLPVAASPLLGRERGVAELVELLATTARHGHRAGRHGQDAARAPGRGRTRRRGLGRCLLGAARRAHRPGSRLPPEIAQAIGAPDDLGGFLRGRELVLLLDNFEHLLDAAPTVSADLAGDGRGPSRARRRAGRRFASLGRSNIPLDPLEPTDAVALFVERARAVGRGHRAGRHGRGDLRATG